MNMRTFAVVLGAVTAACLGTANFTACVIEGSGGTGGDIGTGGSTTVTSSSSTKSSSTATTSSSSGGCDMNLKCGTAITGGDPAMLCAGSASEMLYKMYHDCVCAAGACDAATDCKASVCAMPYKSPMVGDACSTCISGKCMMEASSCANDI